MSEPIPSSLRLYDLIRTGRLIEAHHPWPRAVVSAEHWRHAGDPLAAGQWTLLGMWAEADHVYMALNDESHHEIGVLTCACDNERFPSIGRMHPPAIRLERALRDLWSLEADGLNDTRPWLDHGKWQHPAPSNTRGAPRVGNAYP